MQNKTTHRWLDVQIVIATLAMASSLFLWNLFARGSDSVTSSTTASQQTTSTTSTSSSQSTTQWLLGGTAPQAPSSSNAPSPFTITSSSRP